MIIKILGILDILTAILFWISAFFNIPMPSILTLLALYLIAKGVAFVIQKDPASFLDIFAGLVIFASLEFTIPTIITIITTLYLLQKGVFSLF